MPGHRQKTAHFAVGELVILAQPGKVPVLNARCRVERVTYCNRHVIGTQTGLAFNRLTKRLTGNGIREAGGYDLQIFKLTPELLSEYDGWLSRKALIALLTHTDWNAFDTETLQLLALETHHTVVRRPSPVNMQRYSLSKEATGLPAFTEYVIVTFSGEPYAVLENGTRWRIPYATFDRLKSNSFITPHDA